MIRTKTTHTGKFYLLIVNLFLFVLIAVSMSSCSGGGGGSSSSGSSSSGTGGIAFGLAWKGSATNNTESSVDICATGVATITASVYNSSNALVASGSWPCAAHTGTINSVPAGSNYSVIVEALDSGGSITWGGLVINITVNPGAVTNAGTVTMLNSVDLSSIAITPVNPSISLGSSQQFTAVGTYTDTSTSPSTTSTLDITHIASWTSFNTGIATINNTGLATSVAVGSSNITATFAGISNNTTLTVLSAPAGVIYSTNFSTDAGWGNQLGDWIAAGGVYYAQAPSSNPWTYSSAPTSSLTDFSVSFDVNNASDGGVWLRSSYTNGKVNGLLMVIGGESGTNNGIYFHDAVNGVLGGEFGIVNVPGLQGSNEHFMINVVGNVYSVYLNGSTTPIETLVDSNFSSGLFAFYGFSPRTTTTFANVVISTAPTGYSVSGQVTLNGSVMPGVTVTLTGTGSSSTTTDSNGNYTFTDAANGSYTVTPSLKGYNFTPVSIPLTVNNANITGQNFIATSTATATSYQYVTQWGSPGTGNGQFEAPAGLAVDASGNVYVTDSWNNRIQKFSSSGNFITTWGSPGTGNGQFNNPIGVAVDASGNVYVVDRENNRIQKFTSSGTYITQWGSYGSADGQFNTPYDLAVDASGNVYVADSYNDRVQKFDSSGNFLLTWGSYGSGNGQFNYPSGVAVDASGNVYVSEDVGNSRIQKFTSSGTYITQWGSYGTGNGQFANPYGLAVDASGNVYVADATNNRIQKFSSSGNFITTWGSQGTGNGQFETPTGVTVDVSGNVYVADYSNDRIQVFSPQ